MRTKSILTALCLPLAFTACTNDEFLSESPALGSRGQIDVVLTASRPDLGTDTRMSAEADGDGWKFVWEKDTDVLGAALVDGETAGAVKNTVYVNYPFVADQSGAVSTFSSKSSITAGKYVFYYSYQDVLDRKGLPFGAPEQKFDANSSKSAMQQAIYYMRTISPVIDLEDGVTYNDAQTYKLGLKFANLYTPVTVKINSENIPAGKAPKVTKITLDKKDGNDFATAQSLYPVNAAVNLEAMAGNDYLVTLDEDGAIESSELESALAKVKELIYGGTVYSNKEANLEDDSAEGAFALNVEGDVELKEGTQTELCILVPQGETQYLELKVYTTEGVYTKEIKLEEPVEFRENPKGIAADLNFATDGSGNVILPSTFEISTTQDWDDAIQFMTDHAVGYLNKSAKFILKDDVTVTSLPVFSLEIEGSGDETLTINQNFTFTSDNESQFKLTSAKLAVGRDATLTLNKQPKYITVDITNWGTLNIGANLNNDIRNYGTINVTADATLTGKLMNGRYYKELGETAALKPAIAGTVNVNAGKTLKVAAESANQKGTMTTVGSESMIEFAGAFTNRDVIVNRGMLKGTTELTNNWLIDNYGNLLVPVENNGYVTIESGSRSGTEEKATNTITGGKVTVVDITSFSALQSDANTTYKKYEFDGAVVTTEVSNAVEYSKAGVGEIGITDITLNGGQWNLKSTTGTSTSSKDIKEYTGDGIVGITLKNATLTLTSGDANLGKNLTVEGTSVLKTTENAAAVTGNLTVAEDADFTLSAKITVNGKTNNQAIAAINGKVTVEAGAKAYFKQASVGANGELVVKGSTDDQGAAEFGVNTAAGYSFSNNGVVTSAAGTNTTASARKVGKVTQPINGATGKFNGNATTINFTGGYILLTTGGITTDGTYEALNNVTIPVPTASGSIVGNKTVTIMTTKTDWVTNYLSSVGAGLTIVLGSANAPYHEGADLTAGAADHFTTQLTGVAEGVTVVEYVKDTNGVKVYKTTLTKGETEWTLVETEEVTPTNA